MTGRLDPHGNIRVVAAGEPLMSAVGAMIMLHGRGSLPQAALEIAAALSPTGIAIFAPQASESSWYPHRFVRPAQENEPKLSSALNAVGRLVARVTAAGIPTERIIIGGFSQGACLALEYAARYPAHYGGILGFSGGLIGDETMVLTAPHSGTPLAGTPVFLGTTDHDAHIPLARIRETAAIFTEMGAQVTTRIYPGYDHTINDDEIAYAAQIVAQVAGTTQK